MAILRHSTFRIAPGPGALFTVILGVNLRRMRDSGRPLRTIPAHCSHMVVESLDLIKCLNSRDLEIFFLSKVASSASTSCQAVPLPNKISRSFFSTKVWRSLHNFPLKVLKALVIGVHEHVRSGLLDPVQLEKQESRLVL